MAEVWSFNTTVRNPERMETMLRVLAEMEGVDFDTHGQEQFFGLLIKKRLYLPTRKKLNDSALINAVYNTPLDDELDDAVVEEVISKYRSGSVNAAARGRTPAGVLNRFGLSVARQSKGPVVISELGKKWLNHEITDEDLFTRFFLKWQYTNPIEQGYEGFDLKPFVGVLNLIDRVNEECIKLNKKAVGLSREEYGVFALSLKRKEDIERSALEIIHYRNELSKRAGKERESFINEYRDKRIVQIYNTADKLNKHRGNIKDYTDSSIRYFRVSGLVSLRGGGRYIDIADDKAVEVKSILKSVDISAREFTSDNEYIDYLSDSAQPTLPWQNEEDLVRISEKLTHVLSVESDAAGVTSNVELTQSLPAVKKVQLLQEQIYDVRLQKLKGLKHNIQELDDAIDKLSKITDRNYEPLTARPSLDFEWYAARALMILNDAIRITPSFKVGDDGIPTGFRGNTSDIECEYETFGMTLEVTLLAGRDQWYAEGQPVMRHLRDFEDKLQDKLNTYCMFIAPYIHRDTLNTFWMNDKFGYEGKVQKIVPLSIDQFITILRKARQKILNSSMKHTDLGRLLEDIMNSIDVHDDSQAWLQDVPSKINAW